MADVQRYLEKFHDTIKVGRFDENAVLIEKRDRVLDRLRGGLEALFASSDEDQPEYATFNQGSYEMGTGTKPVSGDYDIDVGICFKIAKADYADPVAVKEWVLNALEGHTKKVEIRRNCVTVWYQAEGEPIYHVDLAIYSDGDFNWDGKTYLAKGKQNSTAQNRLWEEADPRGLISLIKARYTDAKDTAQFRRNIRYLKRWRDEKFTAGGNSAPVGIGLTVAAYYWFAPVKSVDVFSNAVGYDDLEALRRFVQAMLDNFQRLYRDGVAVDRLAVTLPVVPLTDVFVKMTDTQMADFKSRLESLRDVIQAAQRKAAPEVACKLLQGQFGGDFPVPPPEETAQKRGPAILSSSNSG